MVMSITWTDSVHQICPKSCGTTVTKMKIINACGTPEMDKFSHSCGTFFLVPEGEKKVLLYPSYKWTDGRRTMAIRIAHLSFQQLRWAKNLLWQNIYLSGFRLFVWHFRPVLTAPWTSFRFPTILIWASLNRHDLSKCASGAAKFIPFLSMGRCLCWWQRENTGIKIVLW
jgi:hypothetical protein